MCLCGKNVIIRIAGVEKLFLDKPYLLCYTSFVLFRKEGF